MGNQPFLSPLARYFFQVGEAAGELYFRFLAADLGNAVEAAAVYITVGIEAEQIAKAANAQFFAQEFTAGFAHSLEIFDGGMQIGPGHKAKLTQGGEMAVPGPASRLGSNSKLFEKVDFGI